MFSLKKQLFRCCAQIELFAFVGFFFKRIKLYELFIFFNINSMSIISFANIFSPLVGCLFILLMISFAVQKLLSLIRSHLFTFAFISFALGDRSKKVLL